MLIIIAIILLIILCWWFRPAKKGVIPISVEKLAVDVLAHVDSADFSEEEIKELLNGTVVKPTRFRALLVLQVKEEFGLLNRNEANFIMVRNFLRDFMRKWGVRKSHINQHVVIATALSFMPSEQEIIAHQLGASQAAHNRDGMINTLWDSAYGSFGRMLGFKSE